jgi:septal ring factor EnvC (AmiA/AmiB activator)
MEEDRSPLYDLEEKIAHLLNKYQDLKKEKEDLAATLGLEREKVAHLEKKLESFTEDKEKVKARIDQLLQRLKGIEI